MFTLISVGMYAGFIYVVIHLCVLRVTCESGEWLSRSPSSRVLRDVRKSNKLRALDLSHNHLSYLNNKTFLELNVGELVNLSLACNVILCVGLHAFLGLAELKRLDLSGNRLAYIHPDIFNHNQKLYWLSLADNKLFTLPSQSVFIYVSALTFLDLSNCSVANISQSIFKDITNVKYLNISHNSVHDIQYGTFRLLKQLRCLDISFNKLTSLNVDVFINNVNLSDYLPSDNYEACLETEVSSSEVKVKADNNPWNCDCTLKFLFDYVSESISSQLNLTCKEPSRLENSSWNALKHVDCSTSTAPNVKLITDESSSVPARRPVDTGSRDNRVTEESAVNDRMFTPTSQVSTKSDFKISVYQIILMICIVICLCLITCVTLRILKRRQLCPREDTAGPSMESVLKRRQLCPREDTAGPSMEDVLKRRQLCPREETAGPSMEYVNEEEEETYTLKHFVL
jgi:hypothetical protein